MRDAPDRHMGVRERIARMLGSLELRILFGVMTFATIVVARNFWAPEVFDAGSFPWAAIVSGSFFAAAAVGWLACRWWLKYDPMIDEITHRDPRS